MQTRNSTFILNLQNLIKIHSAIFYGSGGKNFMILFLRKLESKAIDFCEVIMLQKGETRNTGSVHQQALDMDETEILFCAEILA